MKIILLFVLVFFQSQVWAQSKRVAVIGAGASGLTAAHELKKMGHEVVVFERSSEVGGLVKTIEVDGFEIELGAILTTNDYRVINELAQKYSVKIQEFESTVMMLKGPGEKTPYKGYTGSNLFKSTLGVASLLKTLLMNKSIFTDGFSGIKNKELFLPMEEFVQNCGMESIWNPFELMLVSCGYGYMDEVPAIYPLKLMSVSYKSGVRGVIESRLLFDRNLRMSGLKRVQSGFQNLWIKLAKELDVRVNTEVLKIDRGTGLGDDQVLITTKQGSERFDKVILSSHPKETQSYLDLTAAERHIFGKVQTYDYQVTVFRAPHLKRSETVYFAENMKRDRLGHVLVYINHHAESDVFVAYQQTNKSTSPEDLLALLKEDITSAGSTIEEVILQKKWDYFPHFNSTDLKSGIYDQFEGLQGSRSTYYTGALMAFETTEHVARHSKALVQRYFGGCASSLLND